MTMRAVSCLHQYIERTTVLISASLPFSHPWNDSLSYPISVSLEKNRASRKLQILLV
jgi:hypothetical protein